MKNFYMNLALGEAWKYQFLTYPNPAVGCVILDKNGKILSIGAHECSGAAHAELNAIKQALSTLKPEFDFPNEPNALHAFILKNHQNLLQNALAFVSLEPCNHQGKTPPCARLFTTLGFKKIYISIRDESALAGGGAEFLRQGGVAVEWDILKAEGARLLKPFLKWQKGKFKLFKLALSLNGSALGKIVSNEQSRTYAHKIRSKVDLLVVGGETMRRDRPILDSRLCGGRPPNLCILSRQGLGNFDPSIPALSVEGREIYTKIPQKARFLMYEGGENFLKLFKDEMDMFLIFQNARFVGAKGLNLDLKLTPLFRTQLGDDNYGIYEPNPHP